MNKKTIIQTYHTIQRVNILYILLPTVLVGVIYVAAIRHNNFEMIRLRNQLYEADRSGQNVEAALTNLRQYVYGHMNTNLATDSGVYPPIQLKYTYERLQAAQNSDTGDNSKVYTDAQAYCEAQNSTSFSGRNRVPCIEAYVQEHGGQPSESIPSAMYKFDFVSPRWSPDLAGFSLILLCVGSILVVAQAITWAIFWWLRK